MEPPLILALSLAAAALPLSSPTLGTGEGRCRADEAGPAFVVDVVGLSDRNGLIRLELYPDNNSDFLADDNVLVAAGKSFRRVETAVPKAGSVQLCIRAPGPGSYALAILHDRDSNRKFGFSSDGIAFPGNPRIALRKPLASEARARVDSGVARMTVRMNYRRGLLSFGPLRDVP